MSNWNASLTWGEMMDLRASFIEGMSRASTFVTVVTTDGAGGRAAVTVSSLTSVSADGEAPALLACIHHESPAAVAILKNRAFCANLLHESQQEVANLFAGRLDTGDRAGRFDRTGWAPGTLAQPLLTGATAAFECRLATSLLWETHYIILGRVGAVHLSDDPAALLYGQRAYRRAVGIEP